MRRSEWRAQETVCGYCRSCGGEIYMGEFCFRLNGRVFCRDCVRSAREIAGDGGAPGLGREPGQEASHIGTVGADGRLRA